MIRLTELKLPLEHAPEALAQLICRTLGLQPSDLAAHTVFKRSFDARKATLMQVYIVDVSLSSPALEAATLARLAGHLHIGATPDMAYRPVGVAPAQLALRPVVIGFGQCGIFAALILAQMGF